MSNQLNLKNKGVICSVADGDLGNSNTSYTYFNLGAEGYRYFSLFFFNADCRREVAKFAEVKNWGIKLSYLPRFFSAIFCGKIVIYSY